MKIKKLTSVLFTNFVIVFLAIVTYGQVETGTTFANGITVARTTDYGNVDRNKSFSAYGYSYSSSNSSDRLTVHQAFINKNNKTYTGYDFQVIPQEDESKFKVLIRPLSVPPRIKDFDIKSFKFLSLPNYPGEISVVDGDIISLNIYENPTTKEKITDYVFVTRKKSVGPRFVAKHIPKDFTIDDVELSIYKFRVEVDGKSIYNSISSGASGTNVGIYLPGKGRFIFSPFPRKGYNFQKIGTIANNTLSFSYNGEKYKIVADSPILGNGGKWHCWVLAQPDFVQKETLNSKNEVLLQSGGIEGFFKN